MRSIGSVSLGTFSGQPAALTRGATGASIRHYLIPDLALVAFLVTLFYCLFLFEGYQKLFRDSDAGWHIRAGESMLAARALPHTDSYSFTRSGQPWFAWEWGSDVLTGVAYQASGLGGVANVDLLVVPGLLRYAERPECRHALPLTRRTQHRLCAIHRQA